MNMNLLKHWGTAICLLLPMFVVPSARGETSSHFSYQVLSFNDGNGNFEGWENENYAGVGNLLFTDADLSGVDSPELICWLFDDYGVAGGKENFPYIVPKGVYGSHSAETHVWELLTVGKNGITSLMPSFNLFGVGFKDMPPMAITIGPRVDNPEPIIISDVRTSVITGEMTDRGIKAVGGSSQAVEVELYTDDNSLSSLTQAYAKLVYRINRRLNYGYEDYGYEDYYEGSVKTTVSAIVGSGNELIELTPIESSSLFGSFTYCCYCLLPREVGKLRIKWEFPEVDNNEVGEIYLRSDDNVGLSSAAETAFCEYIAQRGRSAAESSDPGNMVMSVTADTWYDIDGDGVMEWAFSRQASNWSNFSLNKFNADFKGQHVLNKEFGAVSGWVNYGNGNGNKVDAYSEKEIYEVNGTDLSVVATVDGALSLLDYNNDGRFDFWIKNATDVDEVDEEVLTLSSNGDFVKGRMSVMTPEEYYDYVKQHGSGGLGSGVSFVDGGSQAAPGAFAVYSQIDINNDGYLDFIDTESGRYLLNTGDGRYVTDKFGGTVIFRDFDGDGITDMLSYDSSEKSITVYLQRRGQEAMAQKLFSGLNCGSYIWCHDFDKDGDIDVLVPFNGKDNGGQSYLVMFENQGKGSFKRHENYIDGGREFTACADWDSDGQYEVLSMELVDGVRNLYSFAVDGIDVSDTPEQIYSRKYDTSYGKEVGKLLVADVDNSGVQRIIFSDDVLTPEGGVNAAPDRPAAPKVNYNASTGEVTVSWGLGTDRESASLDLTYELRIGTAPDRGDILWADASADGQRLNLMPGNCGYALQRRLDATSWPAGRIYVSLQVVDGGGRGSQFSEYATFEKALPAAEFIVASTEYLAVGDMCEITLRSQPGDNDIVEWDVDGGEIKSQTPSAIGVVYSTPGDKNIVLSVTDPRGNKSTVSHIVHVMPSRITPALEDIPDVESAFDMDLDGKVELVTSGSRDGQCFYEGDADGNYTAVKRLFNTNIDAALGVCKVVDINRDGLPDVFAPMNSGVEHLINEGDKSMAITKYDFDFYERTLVADIDNDGIVDFSIGRNTGDYVTYTESDFIFNKYYFNYGGHLYDYNGDGLIDLILPELHELSIYENLGNYEFSELERISIEDYKADVSAVGDMDGDGLMDLAWTNAGGSHGISWDSEYAYVRWNDGSVTKIPAPSGRMFDVIYNVFDFDNNGCQDLLVLLDGGQGVSNYVIIYFNLDRSWTIEEAGEFPLYRGGSDVIYKRTDGTLGICNAKIVGPANTPPSAPTDLRVTQNGSAVVIEWNRSTDAETPSVALKYNISVKHKGAEGENAYFISPLNGGVNGVTVPAFAQLLVSNRFTIPTDVIPAGEYEVKVQAVDTQWQQSDFSDTVTFSVAATAAVDMPVSTMVGQTTPVRLLAGYTVHDVDFGVDAVIDYESGNTAGVHWTSEGMKTVSADGFTAQVYVYPALDASFDLPEQILEGARVRLNCDTSHPDVWEVRFGKDSSFKPVASTEYLELAVVDDNTVEITFLRPVRYEIRHVITESYGSADYALVTYASRPEVAPEIGLVTVDDATGKYRLSWSVPSDLKQSASGVNVYKESSASGEFRRVASLPVSETSYVDMESTPDIRSSRYALSYTLDYGESAMTEPHQPIHVMINRGVGSAWNLTWCKYEGRDITTYRILRGSSPDALSCIAEVSGNMTSYSDFDAPESEGYYAIEILADMPASGMGQRVASASVSSRSNVVSVADAGSAVMATSVEIVSATGKFAIDGGEFLSLQLSAYVYPVNATFNRVDWVVADGNDVVAVNQNGLLTALGNGSATVRAYAVDGSGVYGEVSVSVSGWSGIESSTINRNGELTVTASGEESVISGIDASETAPATVRIYNLNGLMLYYGTAKDTTLIVNSSSYPAGLYVVRADSRNSAQVAKFVKR